MWLKRFLLITLFSAFLIGVLPAQNNKTKSVQKQTSITKKVEKLKVEKQEKNEEKEFEKKVHQQIVNQNNKQIEKKKALKQKQASQKIETSKPHKEKNKPSFKQHDNTTIHQSAKVNKIIKNNSTKKNEKYKTPAYTQISKEKKKSIKKSPAFDSKNQKIEQKKIVNRPTELQQKPRIEKKKINPGNGYHQPHVVIEPQHVTYISPRYYHYYVPPRYIYHGIWIRYYMDLPDGYIFYNGYPYFVYNNYLHRYSIEDTGYFDLVDSWNDETYATFYGDTLKDSYDRCADLRDRLNAEYGEERFFCSERFDYDPDYKYGWDPDDYPDWYWY